MTTEQKQATCGQRAVAVRAVWLKEYDTKVRASRMTGSCVQPAGHGPDHRDADGNTWTESVR